MKLICNVNKTCFVIRRLRSAFLNWILLLLHWFRMPERADLEGNAPKYTRIQSLRGGLILEEQFSTNLFLVWNSFQLLTWSVSQLKRPKTFFPQFPNRNFACYFFFCFNAFLLFSWVRREKEGCRTSTICRYVLKILNINSYWDLEKPRKVPQKAEPGILKKVSSTPTQNTLKDWFTQFKWVTATKILCLFLRR